MNAYGYGFDPLYGMVLVVFALSMLVQFRVRSVFKRYATVLSRNGYPAAHVARALLDARGIYDVRIDRARGTLTDHFDPRTGVLALSDDVHDSSSIAALGVAAHEVGHVFQKEDGYMPMRIRQSLLPVAQIGSYAAFPLFLLGIFLSMEPLISIGIAVFIAVVFFYIVTLPVEFNASRRAISALADGGYLTAGETGPAKKVLNAAGMTYIMAAIQAMLQLIRLLAMSGRRRS